MTAQIDKTQILGTLSFIRDMNKENFNKEDNFNKKQAFKLVIGTYDQIISWIEKGDFDAKAD